MIRDQQEGGEPGSARNQSPSTLELFVMTAIATVLTACVVYPWVSLWFQPPNAKPWAVIYFPTIAIVMPLVAPRLLQRKEWLTLPLASWLVGTVTLYGSWHAGYDWQRLPPWSVSNYISLIADWCVGGMFLGMWFPGVAWVALLHIWRRVRKRTRMR